MDASDTHLLQWIVSFTLCLSVIKECSGMIDCYSCQYSPNDEKSGYECVTSPETYDLGPPTVMCRDTCYTQRTMVRDTPNIYLMSRGCGGDHITPGCSKSAAYETCNEICDEKKCNKKDFTPKAPPGGWPKTTAAPKQELGAYIWCYICEYTGNPLHPDSRKCVDNPRHATGPCTIKCAEGRVCNIMRQFDSREKRMRSFSRGCIPKNKAQKKCFTDPFFHTCFDYCESDYCNTGNGVEPSKTVKSRTGKAQRRGSGVSVHPCPSQILGITLIFAFLFRV